MNSSNSSKLLIGIALTAFMLLFPVRMGLASYRSAQDDVKKANEQAAEIMAKVDAVNSEAPRSKKFTDKLAAYQVAIPPTGDLKSIINLLGQAADQAGVVWQSGTPTNSPSGGAASPTAPVSGQVAVSSAPTTIPGASVWNVAIQVTGSLDQVKAYLRNIRSSPRLVTVSGVTIALSEESTTTASLNAQFLSSSASP